MCGGYVATLRNLETGTILTSEPYLMLANAAGEGSRMLHVHVPEWPRTEGFSAFRILMRWRRLTRDGYQATITKVDGVKSSVDAMTPETDDLATRAADAESAVARVEQLAERFENAFGHSGLAELVRRALKG